MIISNATRRVADCSGCSGYWVRVGNRPTDTLLCSIKDGDSSRTRSPSDLITRQGNGRQLRAGHRIIDDLRTRPIQPRIHETPSIMPQIRSLWHLIEGIPHRDIGCGEGRSPKCAAAIHSRIMQGVGLKGPRVDVGVEGDIGHARTGHEYPCGSRTRTACPTIQIGICEERGIHIVIQRRITCALAYLNGTCASSRSGIRQNRLRACGSYSRNGYRSTTSASNTYSRFPGHGNAAHNDSLRQRRSRQYDATRNLEQFHGSVIPLYLSTFALSTA